MKKFVIQKSDPKLYKAEILKFWKEPARNSFADSAFYWLLLLR